MLRIPPELLSTLRSPPVQASDIANQKVTPERSPVTHIPRLLEILPSTPPPPSSSGSLSLTSISGMKTTVTKSRSLTDMALEPDPGDTPRPVQHAAVEVPKTNQTPTTLKAGAQPKALSPSFGVHSPAMKRKSAANVHTNASVQASVDLLGSQPLPKDGQEIEPNDRSGDHAKQTSTSNPAKRKKKAEPLPRFALDSPDEEDLNDIVATPLKDHSESRVSMLVDVDFIKNVASSPQNGAVGATSAQTEMPVLASRSFYGVSKRLFRSQSPPVHSAPSDAPARQEQSPNGARPRKMARVFGDQDRNSVRSGSSFSGESSDGFEFVSFAQDFSENTSRVDVKLKAVDTPVLVTLKDNEPTLLDISSHAERLSNNEQPAPASRSTSAEATSAFQLKTISQQDLDALLSRLNTSLRKKARSTSIVSSRSAQVNSATTRSSPSKATAHTESDRPPVVKYRKIPSIEQKPAVAPPSPKHKALKKRDVLPRRASLKGQANSAATHLLPSSSSSPVIGSVILSDHASASRKARVSDVVKPLSRSLSGSARTGQQSEARQAIAAIMGDIKMYLESKGLTRRQSIDLW